MKENKIAEIVDKYLKWLIDNHLNKLPIEISIEMADINQDVNEEWRTWFPIKSTVTDEDIIAFESLIAHKLPEDYKIFLKHKHFYELYITNQVSLCSHPIGSWKQKLSEMIFEGYPTEFLIDKGLIPFAGWSDWGLLCFNTNDSKKNYDYSIVLWNHDSPDSFEYQYENFMSMLLSLDSKLDEFEDSDDD
jgi:SMI1-KNR4 cell-wall